MIDHFKKLKNSMSMIDHFKKLKNSINTLKKIEKSIDRSIGLKKSINWSQKIDQAMQSVTVTINKYKNESEIFLLAFPILHVATWRIHG